VLGSAFAGGAAGNMIRGSTIHKLFGTPVKKNEDGEEKIVDKKLNALTNQQLQDAKKRFGGVTVLLLDELSMVNPVMLGHIHQRLGETLGKPHFPFSDLSVVGFGDFFFLQPAGRAFLCMHLSRTALWPAKATRPQPAKPTRHSAFCPVQAAGVHNQ